MYQINVSNFSSMQSICIMCSIKHILVYVFGFLLKVWVCSCRFYSFYNGRVWVACNRSWIFKFRTEFITSSLPGMIKSNVLKVGANSSFALERLMAGVSWYYVNITWTPRSTQISENIFCFSAVGSTT